MVPWKLDTNAPDLGRYYMDKLNEKQRRILEYIAEATAQQGYPPSVREIGKHVGLRSSSSVHAHLMKLREAGYQIGRAHV